MGKLINQFPAETIPQLQDNLVLAKPDNITKSMSLAVARDFFVSDMVLLAQKLIDLGYSVSVSRSEAEANFIAIAAINTAQDSAIANKASIHHFHSPTDIDGFAAAVSALSAVAVQDETSLLGNARVFNFAGAGITASLTGDTATILVSGLGAGGGSSDVWDTIDLSSWDALY